MSTLAVNTITTQTGDTVTLPTGKKIVAADTASIIAPGVPIQTVTHSWDSHSSQLSVQTYSWSRYPSSEIQITAKRANSLYVIHYQIPVASRSGSAASTDIHFKVGSSGTWAAARVAAPGGTNGYYGVGTLWGTNSSDDWNTPSLMSSRVVSSNVGDVIYFRAALRSGGPGSDNLNGVQLFGHPYFTAIGVVTEIAQ